MSLLKKSCKKGREVSSAAVDWAQSKGTAPGWQFHGIVSRSPVSHLDSLQDDNLWISEARKQAAVTVSEGFWKITSKLTVYLVLTSKPEVETFKV